MQSFVFERGDAEGPQGFRLGAATDGPLPPLAACPAGGLLHLVFGPLWVSAYGNGALVWRGLRADGLQPYRLDHDDALVLTPEDAATALASTGELLDPLDRGQLLLLSQQPDAALALSGEAADTVYAPLLRSRAVRQAFEARKQQAMALAGAGQRAHALDVIGSALALYGTAPAGRAQQRAPGSTERDRPRFVLLADLSLPQCRHYRVEQKLEQLAMAGIDGEVFELKDSDAFVAALEGATLALFYRLPLLPKVQEALTACRSAGLPCLFEIDDLLFEEAVFPGPRHTYGADLQDEEYNELLILPPLYRALMTACDGTIASTPALAAEMRRHMGEVPVFLHENGLGQPHLAAMQAATHRPRPAAQSVRLFYGSGTRALQEDFNRLADHALAPLLSRHKALRLTLAGHCDLPESLQAFAPRIDRIAPQSLEGYWRQLADADINLAPLSPGRFNDCKSAIKWLEAAMFGIPSVVSATETYKALIKDGEDGLIAPDWSDWTAALDRLIGDEGKRRHMGETAKAKALRLFSPEVLSGNIREIVQAASRVGR